MVEGTNRASDPEQQFIVVIDDEIGHSEDIFGWDDLPAGLQQELASAAARQVTWASPDGGRWIVTPRT